MEVALRSSTNFTRPKGIPTLAGHEPRGDHAHADSEQMLLSSLVQRISWRCQRRSKVEPKRSPKSEPVRCHYSSTAPRVTDGRLVSPELRSR